MRGVSSQQVATALFAVLLILAAAFVFSAVTLGQPSAAVAQDEEAADAGGDEGGGAEEEQQGSENMLVWLYRSLGLKYVICFLAITFTMITLFVKNLLDLRREQMIPPALVQAFEAHLNEKRYQEAYELAKADESFLGKVLAAGLLNLANGYDKAQAAMQETGGEENMKISQRLGYVALCAQIGPMFGLLGTVDGMVQAFDVIAKSTTTPKPSELAVGIGTALVTTVVGLWIAIPSIIYYNIVKNRLDKLMNEVGMISENLMSRFASVGGGGGGAGGAKK